MLLISKTYSEVTPESAENGEHSDSGFVFQDEPFTFRELVEELRNFSCMSSCPSDGSTHDWASTYMETVDYATGTDREESLHFSRKNPARAGKYWAKALRAAGLI